MQDLIEVLLNPEFDTTEVYRLGSWFLVPEAAIREAETERPFAPGKAKRGVAVLRS